MNAKGEGLRESWERAPGSEATLESGSLPPYRFLSVFDWTLHKGWEVLVEAFVRAFPTPESTVGERGAELWIKTWSTNGYTLAQIRGQVEAHLRGLTGQGLDAFPHLHVWEEHLPTETLPRLYRAFDAFVLPTRGEGWCRPLMEAMAAGLPTIATAWSGLTAFHNAEVGYPLPYRLVPVSEVGAREIPLYTGHCWAEPNAAALQRLLRQLVEHPEAARAKGRLAQSFITTEFSRAAVTPLLQAELAHCRQLAAQKVVPAPRPTAAPRAVAAPASSPPSSASPVLHGELRKPKANPVPRDPVAPVSFVERLGRPLRVRWEGDFALRSSLALVNREFCLELLAGGDVELSLAEQTTPWHRLTESDDPRFAALLPLRNGALSGPPDVTIRHHFPPSWSRPEHGKLVVIQPWEYGHLPQDWVPRAGAVDEVWAYSRFVREVYARSGVPAEKVRVVPLGFRPEVFQPEGPHYPLRTEKWTRFLFVGGALDRKGADLLLQAYLRAFRREDDVCLVMKDMGTRTFYQGQTFADAYRQVQADPRAPEVHYLDDDLSDLELAALYRSCTAVVLPYRGEGFGLSPLEGMACGLPVIVTAGGPTDDYVSDETGLRVPQRRRCTGDRKVGPFSCTGDPWQLEPDLDALTDALRWVHDHPEEARQRGLAGREQAAAWTWSTATAHARERLAELILPAASQPVAQPLAWTGATGNSSAPSSTNSKKATSPGAKRFQPPQRKEVSAAAAPISAETQSGARISLCMIARDEEPRLGDCLRSIAPYVDELIVVDTGSTDRTREVARECGAQVYDLPWPDSFAAARNASIDLATGDWIFWMDADDVISPECGAGLRKLVAQHPQHDAAYHIAVHIPPGPGEFSPSVVDHVKLFPNRPDLRFEHRIHEQILPALRRVGLDLRFSDLYVTHQNYDRSDEGQAKKRRRDYRLLELDLLDRPDHPFVLFNLGMTYLYATKEYELAAHYLRRSLDHSHPADSIVRKAYAMLGTARICQGEWEAAIQANEEGRRHYPADAELLFQAGQVYQQLGRFDQGRRCLEQLTEGQEDEHYRSVDVGLRTYRGRHELALLFRRMGDAPHCEQVLREIAAQQPSYLTAQVDLVETMLHLGREGEARQLLERIPAVKGVAEDLQRLSSLIGERA
jgi:glycosyltransferase involved in cell wall biosynthesis/tetratricopeptide (TPR) repeat protein